MRSRFLVLIMTLALSALACSILVGGPAYPEPQIPPSSQSVEDAQTQIERAVTESAQTGSFTLVITESQLTDFLASKLDEQSSPFITEPEVVLQDGVIRIYGKAQSGLLVANISASARVTIDENGQPKIEVTGAEFGPIPMPEGIASGLSAFLQETLTGSVGPAATGFRLESVDIADGVMTVTGRTK
jgi:hypothetical protein